MKKTFQYDPFFNTHKSLSDNMGSKDLHRFFTSLEKPSNDIQSIAETEPTPQK